MSWLDIPLAPLLHTVTQALLVPVLGALLLASAWAVYQLGLFCAEWWTIWRGRGVAGDTLDAVGLGPNSAEPGSKGGEEADTPSSLTRREAEQTLSRRELSLARRLERTDLLVKLGPALGLVGTLIPLGPGLSALGRGEVRVLAESLTVAFDTTILGLLVGAAAYVISRVRRRWYEEHMERLTVTLERMLDAESDGSAAYELRGGPVGS